MQIINLIQELIKMGINSTILSVFSATLTLAVLPGIATAQSPIIPGSTGTTSAPTSPTSPQGSESRQQRSAIQQALVRERNIQIIELLDENQKNKFYEGLRKRRKLSTNLESLNLSPDQQNRVNAILSDYNAKLNAVKSGQSLQPTQQTAPTTTTPSGF